MKQPSLECFWKIINGQSGKNLYFILLWHGNLEMLGGLVGKLTWASATTRFTPQLVAVDL